MEADSTRPESRAVESTDGRVLATGAVSVAGEAAVAGTGRLDAGDVVATVDLDVGGELAAGVVEF
jgi:hypothetical protein